MWQLLFGSYHGFCNFIQKLDRKKALKPKQEGGALYSPPKPGWEHQGKIPQHGSKCVSNITINTRKESSPGIQRGSWHCLWNSVENGVSTHFSPFFSPRGTFSFSAIAIFSNKLLNSATVHTGHTLSRSRCCLSSLLSPLFWGKNPQERFLTVAEGAGAAECTEETVAAEITSEELAGLAPPLDFCKNKAHRGAKENTH